jgi:hypothetical protein
MEFFMRWILLLLPTLVWAQDFIPEQRISSQSDLVEYFDDDQSFADKKWSVYLYDKCNFYDRNVQNEDQLRQIGLRRCKDGSISFVQPKSDGWNGWEGKCGPTAASNALFHLCKKGLDPNKYVARYMSDATPGVRPKTLTRGLRTIFNLNKENCPSQNLWKYNSFRDDNDFIANVKQDIIPKFSHKNLLKINRYGKTYFRNPVIVLIQNPGGNYLHWVTIVDIVADRHRCEFVVNHWNKQYYVPCDTMSKWSGKVGRTYPIILKSYSTVRYK